jgi:hypothetical protein
MKLYAISDLHVEQPLNRQWIDALPSRARAQDVLLVAGDVGCRCDQVMRALDTLRSRYARVVFVPGNHELWHGDGERMDGVERLERLLERCRAIGVDTGPVRIGNARGAAWVVPLHAWYAGAGERETSLWTPDHEGEPWPRWRESLLVRWPAEVGDRPARWMLSRNAAWQSIRFDAPVITFSHFLPRRELMRSANLGAGALRLPDPVRRRAARFSLIAGCSALDGQVRGLGARLHVYGHQHRNRRRWLEGVEYRSCCLGHPHERAGGQTADTVPGPVPLWCSERGFLDPPLASLLARWARGPGRLPRAA